MVKTVTLAADTPQKVTFEGAYPYYWIDNKTASDVYASVCGTPEADKDDTYTVAAGSQMRISGGVGNDGITLLGEGKVQIIASTIAACPFKAGLGGGGIQSINGIISNGGNLALTQSDIPSDGTAYQMPYYIQSGTVTTTGTMHTTGLAVSFKRAYKTPPLLFITAKELTINSNHLNVIANYRDLTATGFVAMARFFNSSGSLTALNSTNYVTQINWLAIGQSEV